MGTTLEKLSNMLETIMLEDKPEFSLVIPAYNEVGRIESTLKNLMFALDYQFSFAKNFELLIIMDGCQDGTPEAVKALIKNRLGIIAIVLPNRLGKGGAIIEALKYAQGDLIAFIDADGSVPLSELNRLMKFADQYDLVIGSRYKKSSVLPYRRPFKRFLFGRSFNVLTKLLFWRLHDIKDSQCGLKVFSKDLVNAVNGDLLITDFVFDVNLIYSAARHGFKTKEVGIAWIDKDGGKLSRNLIKQTFIMSFSLFRLRLYYSPMKHLLESRLYQEFAKFFYSCSKT